MGYYLIVVCALPKFSRAAQKILLAQNLGGAAAPLAPPPGPYAYGEDTRSLFIHLSDLFIYFIHSFIYSLFVFFSSIFIPGRIAYLSLKLMLFLSGYFLACKGQKT